MTDAPTFTGYDAARTQQALRDELGLPPEQFPLEAFIGMVSDEIEQLRAQGRDDAAIAALLSKLTGQQIAPADVTANYADPAARGHHG